MRTDLHGVEPEELMAYLDGELSEQRTGEVVNHLEGCFECQAVVDELRSVSAGVARWRVEPVTADKLPDRLAARLKRLGRGRFLDWFRSYRWAVCSLGVPLILISSVIVRNSFQGEHGQVMVSRDIPVPQSPQPYLTAPPRPGISQSVVSTRRSLAQPVEQEPASTGPMIAHTTTLSLTTRDFAGSRARVESAVQRHAGLFESINVSAPEGAAKKLNATIRIPSASLEGLLGDLRKIGTVLEESQSGTDMAREYVDLDARLRNARNTEQRLSNLLRERAAKLSDVLEVENEISRVRGQIERMEAERRGLLGSVDLATVHVTVAEVFKAQLDVVPPSGNGRLWNAAVDGYRGVTESLVEIGEVLLAWGPTVLLWGLLAFWPLRMLWRRIQS